MKLTKRKQFLFYRSYYDVFNELNDDDKLIFIKVLFDKQFLDEDPKPLKGMVKFAYISQMDSIEKQVKGFCDKTKTPLNPLKKYPWQGGENTPTQGGENTPSLQEKEKEKEKEESIYSEYNFLKNWSTCRRKFLNKPTNISKLENYEKVNFDKAKREFTKEEINLALLGLFKQENKNISSMYLKPKHFLENVSKYLNAELAKQYDIYGKDESKQSKKGGL